MAAGTMRVLLVDGHIEDSRWVQELLAEFGNCGVPVWMHGIGVLHLDRLEDTLTLLSDPGERGQIDVILANASLPDSFGLPTLLKIQAQAPEIPVIMMAEMDDAGLAVSMVRAGAQDFVVKPELDSTPLARSLRFAIERSRVVRDLRTLSWRDRLTGLFNGFGFESQMQHDLAVGSEAGFAMAVAVIRVRGLDELDARYGAEERDMALIECAEVIRRAVGPSFTPAFLPPAEFAVAYPAPVGGTANRPLLGIQHELRRLWAASVHRALLRFRFGLKVVQPGGGSATEALELARAAVCENDGERPGWHDPAMPLAAAENLEHQIVNIAYRPGRDV